MHLLIKLFLYAQIEQPEERSVMILACAMNAKEAIQEWEKLTSP